MSTPDSTNKKNCSKCVFRPQKVTTKKRKSDTKPVEDSEEELTLKEEEKVS